MDLLREHWCTMNLVVLQRAARRFLETGLSMRSNQKRIAVLGCLTFVVFVYVFVLPSTSNTSQLIDKCVADQFAQKRSNSGYSSPTPSKLAFVGNGFIGIETAVDKQLLVAWPNGTSIKTPIYTSFRPLVDVSMPFQTDEKFRYVSDFNEGVSKGVRCSIFSEKCFCINQLVYAHRTRPYLLIHEIRVSNPTTSFMELSFNRRGNPDWDQTISGNLPAVYLKTFGDYEKVLLAVVCSSAPLTPVSIKAQTEETFRFLCVVEQSSLTANESETITRRKIVRRIADDFTQLNAINSNLLDTEHFKAWERLNYASFNIDHSKAPNALNPQQINITRHALLSTVRAPILESFDTITMAKVSQALSRTELCYSGHSTLLTPSKLWQDWSNVQELLRTMEIWLMTLEHRGCVHLLQAGATGVMHAFLLSLLAATFTHHRLEIALDPESDLHRQIHVQNIRVGNTHLALYFNLDSANKPFAEIAVVPTTLALADGKRGTNLYACSAGCLEPPTLIGERPIRFAIKITKPPTPILFIAEDREHLSQVKDTLHVAEVVDAPAPETHKIDLHKNGEGGGLPTIFWFILISLLISFHLFLFKLLYSEWQNSSSVPYSKFNKRFLLRR